MARQFNSDGSLKTVGNGPKTTSIGDSPRTRRKNKSSTKKKSRGQGSGRRR